VVKTFELFNLGIRIKLMGKNQIRQIILIAGLTFFSFSILKAQTTSNGIATRQQTIQKGKVLRKTGKIKSVYYVNGGSRINKTPKHPLTDSASRIQPMVTKPLIPVQ
jgi:hypothetical protein